jgi:putative membrane protein
MKKIAIFVFAAFALYAVQGCHGSGSSQSADSTAKADSAAKTDSSATMTAAVDSSDANFAKEAAGGGMAEVQLSKLAQQKSNNQKIKDFAAMMITDHTNAGDTLAMIAKNKNITLPAGLDPDHQKIYDELSKMSGPDFDKKYLKVMADDHQGALKLMQNEAANGKDADLKAFAAKVAIVVQKHINALDKITGGMK